ncbi:MAG TPA: hypothetical protein VKC56_06925 [Gallionellaceae bacterium]|nr:hypothetical protein [Gallionellaceae bacterium]
MTPEMEQRLIAELDSEWQDEGGFLFDYEAGKFNEEAYERVVGLIVQVCYGHKEAIPKRVVERIYNIPFFLLRNKTHVLNNGGSRMLCNLAINNLNELLADTFSPKSQWDLMLEKFSRRQRGKPMCNFDD